MPTFAVLPASTDPRPANPLHGSEATRRLEQAALACSPPHALMAQAGLATARLAAAVRPHGRRAWVLAGPGNNGGDALVAARHLQAWGWQVQVSLVADPAKLPDDARHALNDAKAAGVPIHTNLPAAPEADLVLDGLLGIGARRAPDGVMAAMIGQLHRLRAQGATVLAIDLPSGLSADTGQTLGEACVAADHTLSLLTLKPGLFTGAGRDHAGRVWWDDLGTGLARARLPEGLPGRSDGSPQAGGLFADGGINTAGPTAWLGAAPTLQARSHRQHKGSQGDLLVLGGAPGMGGAAWLAARAALAAGAGRVWVGRLGEPADTALAVDPICPELMPRPADELLREATLAKATVVYGCGAGAAAQPSLARVLQHAGQLVLDADGLNALAELPAAWSALAARPGATVLTPHPLEAARLLGSTVAAVQADRLQAARTLADRSQAVVLLKGSGTVLCAPGGPCLVNPSGNARLATAGTGDVLAGWLGGWLACGAVPAVAWPAPADPHQAKALRHAVAAAWVHGQAAELIPEEQALRAGALAAWMARSAAGLARG